MEGTITYKTLFGVIGNVIGVGVNLAPVGTFYNIYRKKSTQGFSGLPYVFGLSAALLWLVYGNPAVTPASTLLLTINSAASFIQICYLTIYFLYGAQNRRRHVFKVLSACLTALAIVAVVTFTLIAKNHRTIARQMVGILCVVIGIMSYASPLSVARIVIITKSVEFLPIVLICFLFINSVIWTCYGIFTKDIFVMIPNGFGVAFGVSQLSLYLIYRNCTPVDPLDPSNWKLPKDDASNSKVSDVRIPKVKKKKKQNPINDESIRGHAKDIGGKMNGTIANGNSHGRENGAAANGDVKHIEPKRYVSNRHAELGNHFVDVPTNHQPVANGHGKHDDDEYLSSDGTREASLYSPSPSVASHTDVSVDMP